MKELNLVLLGPPGAGKGTQAARLRDDLRLTHVSTGDMLRSHRAAGTALGREAAAHMASGRLVPDSLVISMLLHELRDGFPGGVLLDGFPRTVTQADALHAAFEGTGRELAAAVLIDVPDDVIVQRLSGRLMCPTGHVFHCATKPPLVTHVCDHDGLPLTRRDDDRPETVRHRLAVYHEQTEPLIAYYEQRGMLMSVDGTRAPADVAAQIAACLAVDDTGVRR